MSFPDSLEATLTLSAAGTELVAVPAGQLERIDVTLESWGFAAEVEFWLCVREADHDPLYETFVKQDLLTAKLELERALKQEEGTRADPLEVTGLVSSKGLREEALVQEDGYPVVYRHYAVQFQDAAAHLWSQHYPCELYTDSTWKTVLDAHLFGTISLTADWDVLTAEHAILTLGLGYARQASFYDFVCWLAGSNGGIFSYDPGEDAYTLGADKPSEGDAEEIRRLDIEELRVHFPATIRHDVGVLNGSAPSAQRELVQQDQAVQGVRQDLLLRTDVQSAFDGAVSAETAGLVPREHELELRFRRYPTTTLYPWGLAKLEEETGAWSPEHFARDNTYRVRSFHLGARAKRVEPGAGESADAAAFIIDAEARLELQAETAAHLPRYASPSYPIPVEGYVVSDQGDEGEETYEIYTDADTSLDQYKVKIPLWDDQLVVLPYLPRFFSGHFYFPLYRDQRVLVHLSFQSATIHRCLDWRPGARLPQDGQGNHLLLGKLGSEGTDNTSLSHVYEDNQPVFSVLRTLDKDTQLVELSQGRLFLEVQEEDGG